MYAQVWKEGKDIQIVGKCRDCISVPKSSGFRALTQDLNIKITPRLWFPFEMQIMTYLCHDWDQKQHIVYENREEIPAHIQQVFIELSNDLYKADQTFESIRQLVQGFTKKK